MRVITRGTRKDSEITVRELTDAETDAAMKAKEIITRMNYRRVPPHLQDELQSFLNEEVFIYACKYDGVKGSLVGYIVSSLNMRVTTFLKLAINKEKRNIYEDTGDNDEKPSIFDTLHDNFNTEESDMFLDLLNYGLTEREYQVVSLLYKGCSIKEVCDITGKSLATINRDRYKIQDKLKGHYLEGFKRKESNFTAYNNKAKEGNLK